MPFKDSILLNGRSACLSNVIYSLTSNSNYEFKKVFHNYCQKTINTLTAKYNVIRTLRSLLQCQIIRYLVLTNVKNTKLSFFDQFSENCSGNQRGKNYYFFNIRTEVWTFEPLFSVLG